MYRLSSPTPESEPNSVIRLFDGANIPFDETNADYQEYLAWIAEGNEPEVVES